MIRYRRNGSCAGTLARSCGLLAVLALAACGGVPQPPMAGSAVEAGPSSLASGEPETEQHAASPPSDSNSSKPSGPDGRTEIVPLTQLPGMSGEQVIKLLGTPQFSRGEPVVELWQYRNESCVLHLFLYRTGEALRVRHAEVRSRPAPDTATGSVKETGPAANSCLAKLAAAHASPTS